MSIRRCIDAQALNEQLGNLEACAENAPDGAYDHAKQISAFLGETFDHLRTELAAIGLKLDNSDKYREFEAVLYGLIKDSNPECYTFPVSEGFGSSMDGPARERVIAQAASSVAFLKGEGATFKPVEPLTLEDLFGSGRPSRSIADDPPGTLQGLAGARLTGDQA